MNSSMTATPIPSLVHRDPNLRASATYRLRPIFACKLLLFLLIQTHSEKEGEGVADYR